MGYFNDIRREQDLWVCLSQFERRRREGACPRSRRQGPNSKTLPGEENISLEELDDAATPQQSVAKQFVLQTHADWITLESLVHASFIQFSDYTIIIEYVSVSIYIHYAIWL